MKKTVVLVSTVFVFLLMTGCGKNDNSETSGNLIFDSSLPSGQMIFSALPTDISDSCLYIMPLGNLSPPEHTRPSDHIYFVCEDAIQRNIYAPASGKIIDKYNFDKGECRITIGVTNTASYYFMHIVLDPTLHLGSKVKAGQKLGTTSESSIGFDMGVMIKTIEQPFVDPALYGPGSIHCDSPIKHFTDALKTQLYARVRREGTDKDGKICYDRKGKLAGNWIAENAPRDPFNTDHFDSYFVAFVYDNYYPSKMCISIGNSSFATSMDKSSYDAVGTYFVQENAKKFEEITPADGKQVYKLYNTGRFSGPEGIRKGLLLVQMLNDDKIKVECFNDTVSDNRDFTSNAKIYVR